MLKLKADFWSAAYSTWQEQVLSKNVVSLFLGCAIEYVSVRMCYVAKVSF